METAAEGPIATGITAPLRYPVFRNIWLASLLSNFGILILGVGAAWAMTQLSPRADMVALVQTALMLPIMFAALPAGAIADMYDRRIVALIALLLSLAGASGLTALGLMDVVTPHILLAFCFIIGFGMALMGPAWQASVGEQVPAETLPSAIALNSISYNIARSFGPAIGGVIVAAVGAVGAFAVNAIFYLPILTVLYRWQRMQESSRLPPERIGRAIISGVRYVIHSPAIRVVLIRTILTGVAGSSISALMPLVARDLLGGNASVYGVMLGAFGVGAVAGALGVGRLRNRMRNETIIRLALIVFGGATAIVAASHWHLVTGFALLVAGACWMISITIFNIGVQLPAPRWVTGRALASFQASIAGGIALGSWVWGYAATIGGVTTALVLSAGAIALSSLLGLTHPVPDQNPLAGDREDQISDPEIALAITSRSGPIVIELEYKVDPASAREFYTAMQEVQLVRQRNGGYGWSIARNLGDPSIWTERFHCPTWLDYLHMRNRRTRVDQLLLEKADALHIGPEPIRIERRLERPFGSVRWKEETPDRDVGSVLSVPSPLGTGN